jgi:hypothetical protein
MQIFNTIFTERTDLERNDSRWLKKLMAS